MKKIIKGILIGSIVTFMLTSTIIYATEGINTIEVLLNSVGIELNGEQVAEIDEMYTLSNGNEVPFSIVYKGTTYLPIRRISELLNKEVTWDASTRNIGLNDIAVEESNDDSSEVIANNDSNNESTQNQPEITWEYGGYEGKYPFKEYEYKVVDGVKTTEIRYTGTNKDLPIFRDVKFGMSKTTVAELAGDEIGFTTEDIIYCSTRILGFDSNLYYAFDQNDKLGEILFSIDETHSNDNFYIDDYYDIQKELIQKFGEPVNDEIIWYNDLFKDDYSNWGLAVSAGHLKYVSAWEFDDMTIVLILNGDNYEINLFAGYTSNIYIVDSGNNSGL